ncbi:flagellar biosynthetic protein FliQ [Candidatus Margulisiibacteriota bacterium]
MTIELFAIILRRGIMLVIMLSIPAIGTGLLIGLIVAFVQAITQIQEQTLTFVPKMLVIFIIIGFISSWMAGMMVEFAHWLWQMFPGMVY